MGSKMEVPKFIQKQIDNHYKYPCVLVCEEKHGTRYLKAGTKEELLASCLKMLIERYNERWYYKPEAPSKKPSVPLEQAQALPDGALKNMALREHDDYKRAQMYYEDDVAQFAVLEEAIKTKNGYLAYQALHHRRDYEYEGFEVHSLE